MEIKKKHICTGLLAHVDAGKTTLSEGIMYLSGQLRRLGRVDHGDAFLDTFAMERARGITIFSKQAVFDLGEKRVTILDTPGHVDFSAEMERTLSVLDYAVLVISGPDGVQGHTETLWNLLQEYEVPTFLFVNKMDQAGVDQQEVLGELQRYLGDGFVPFGKEIDKDTFYEEIAMCDEEVLDAYMNSGEIEEAEIIRLIAERKVFPCYFGSALKLQGIEELLSGLERYTTVPEYGSQFAARVYKISRDEQGNRLTHLKVTGGSLKVKMPLGEEKVDQIRVYSGTKYQLCEEAPAGMICSVTGLSDTVAGQGLGEEKAQMTPLLTPVLSRQIILPEGQDVAKALRSFRELEEEEPELHITWNPQHAEIQVQLMGEVQTEILAGMIEERYQIPVTFGEEHIMYRETIRGRAEGVGHYEPLRHYAEVHLLLEEGTPGSGLIFDADCSEDELDRNWQRLILTHLQEKEHLGVLTGSPITDMKITLTAGRAHLKHTEGGDFRQATYRAVRQGLMGAQSVLLEPWYEFRLELPAEQIGRGMADIQRMSGEFTEPDMENGRAILTGKAPAVELKDYQREVWAYSGGRGRLTLRFAGYEPCHNEKEVVRDIGYDCEGDLENPSGSIFCAHGAGFFVPWQEVPEHMHIQESCLEEEPEKEAVRWNQAYRDISYEEDKELREIFEREFGKRDQKRNRYGGFRREFGTTQETSREFRMSKKKEKEYLLVDGYNIIFAWEELKDLAEASLDAARGKLVDMMCNYQGFVGCELILVFDAYKVKGNTREVYRHHNIHIVYTKEAETADQYIEKTTHELGRKYRVRVATSDALEQVIVMGQGAERVSARDFYKEVELVNDAIRQVNEEKRQHGKNYLFDHMEEDMADMVEQVRLGKKSFQHSTSNDKIGNSRKEGEKNERSRTGNSKT